jgi:hypothetical protein
MNPMMAGFTSGTLLAALGFLLLWPVLGQDILKVFGRFVGVFLAKFFLVGLLIVLVHKQAGAEYVRLFATGLLATYLVLMMVQLVLFSKRLKHFELKQGAQGANETENNTSS